MNQQEILNQQQLRKVLGMDIPGLTPQQIYEILKENNLAKEIDQRFKQEQNQPQFDIQATKSYKAYSDKKKGISKKEENGFTSYQVEGVPYNDLTPTQRAFHMAYDTYANILSDNEASKMKQNHQAHSGPIQLQCFKEDTNKEGQTTLEWNWRIPREGVANQNASQTIVTSQHTNYGNANPAPNFNAKGNGNTKNNNQYADNKPEKSQNSKKYQQQQQAQIDIINEIQDQSQVVQQNIKLDTDEQLYCKCRKPYDGSIMIECGNEKCPIQWFHPRCAGLSEQDQKQLETISFFCSEQVCQQVKTSGKMKQHQ